MTTENESGRERERERDVTVGSIVSQYKIVSSSYWLSHSWNVKTVSCSV
jgi:hypothetical protein